jgi:hypothetical protein
MPASESYEIIQDKIAAMKRNYPSLREKSDDYVFTILCVRANFYKNPALDFTDQTATEIVVDGQYDGGVDALLLDPNSEEENLIIVQSKFYQDISFDQVRAAIQKMILFYKDMDRGEYQNVNATVQRRFLTLNAEVGDESKIRFVFYTSAKKNRIRTDRIEKILKEEFQDNDRYEISLLYADDIVEEIKELESRRPTVESGVISIDEANNVLAYGEDAVIVNVSAFSIKELYALHNTNLLSRNLRYYIRKRDIDDSINQTIKNEPDQFWFRNNGITIVCDYFRVDGKIVHLKDFSIVNGGQTTTLIHRSNQITKDSDLYLPCKIIKSIGDNLDEKNQFILDIAKATNSQKPIKQIDLKANAPEQVRFCSSTREVDIFYQTKRGESVPKDYKIDYKNADLAQVGKLCLAGVFQVPAASRSKPSSLYLDRFYGPIFHGNQSQVVEIVKELLYIDYFFRKKYVKEFDKQHESDIISPIAFAHNARTLCISFVALAARVKNDNIDENDLRIFFSHCSENRAYDDYLYDVFSDIGNITSLLPKEIFKDKDKYETVLSSLFDTIIMSGFRYFQMIKRGDASINETNFLKSDQNYYEILKTDWYDISNRINAIYETMTPRL